MGVKIKVGADLSPAQKEVDGFQVKVAAAGKQAGDALASGVEGGASRATTALGATSTAADKTAKATESISKQLHLDKLTAGLGALKGLFDGAATSVLGLSESTAKTTSKVLDMAQKGATLGATFGPWGALAGAAAGAVVGYFSAASEAIKETQKTLDGIRDKANAAVASYKGMEKVDLGALIKQLGELEEAQRKAKGYSKETSDAINALAAEGYESLQKGYDLLAKSTSGIKDNADLANMSSTQLLSAYEKGETALDTLTAKIAKSSAQAKKQHDTFGDGSEILGVYQADLKALTVEYAATQSRMAAIEAAGAKLSGTTVKLTKDTKGLTAATKDSIEAITDSVTVTVTAAEKGQKSQLVNISFYASEAQTKVVETAKKAKEQLDALLGPSTEASTKGATDKFFADLDKEAQARVDKHPIEIPLVVMPAPGRMSVFQVGMDQLKDQAIEAGAAIAQALGGQAVKGIDAMFDAWANGTKRSAADRQRARVEFERATGTMLMTDAVGHMVAGGVKAIVPLTSAVGLAELAGGIAEFGIGAGLGGVGAAGQRRLGGTAANVAAQAGGASAAPSAGPPPAFGGNATSGGTATTQELPGVNYWLTGTVVFPQDPRGMAGLGRFLQTANAAGMAGNAPKFNR